LAAGASPLYGPSGYAAAAQIYAGFWLRFVAVLIDGIIVGTGTAVISFALGIFLGFGAAAMGATPDVGGAIGYTLGQLAGIVIGWLYEAMFLSSERQATPGKMAFGIVVTSEAGARLSFARATGRHFGKYLSSFILFIGYLIQPFTEKKQALHDLLAGTVVVRRPLG